MPFEPLSAVLPMPIRTRLLACFSLLSLFVGLLVGCATPTVIPPATAPVLPAASPTEPPAAPREFRAAWVSTVANIDWPSKPGLSAAQQQAEMITILDTAAALKLNALILQVRPAADAIYPSTLEPWSEYLSGEQGVGPGYDPLALWVQEAHRRGLELHAWFNPFRARLLAAKGPAARNHVSKAAPELVKSYGEYLWMDPGEPAASDRTIAVVTDVLRRYDIDGIHIDDYFYPYPVNGSNGNELPFPDEPSWRRYQAAGGTLGRDDWRRQNVSQLIEHLYGAIHAEKPWVKFGISPFGLGKPERRAAGIVGFSQYDKLYADVELWLQQGWLDYLAPQLYWPIDPAPQAFATLLEGWTRENPLQRHIWPGLFTSGLTTANRGWPVEEITRQIELSRRQPGVSGQIHFSMAALLQDRKGIRQTLQNGPYAQPALVPATPWLAGLPPAAPRLQYDCPGTDSLASSARLQFDKTASLLAIWRKTAQGWQFDVQPTSQTTLSLAGSEAVVVSAVDRLGMESSRVTANLRCQP